MRPAASGGQTLLGGAGGQLRHRAAGRQLLQGLAQVLLPGEYAGHAVQRLADLNFLVRGDGLGPSFMAYLRPKDKPILKLQNADNFFIESAAPENAVSA